MDQWPEARDQAEDFFEQCLGHGHLCHLEREIAPMAHQLGADLDQLLPERCERPVAHLLRQCQYPEKVRQVVGESEELNSCGVVKDFLAGWPRSGNAVLTFSVLLPG